MRPPPIITSSLRRFGFSLFSTFSYCLADAWAAGGVDDGCWLVGVISRLSPPAKFLDTFQRMLSAGVNCQNAIKAFQLGFIGLYATRHPKPSQNIVRLPLKDPFENFLALLKITALYRVAALSNASFIVGRSVSDILISP